MSSSTERLPDGLSVEFRVDRLAAALFEYPEFLVVVAADDEVDESSSRSAPIDSFDRLLLLALCLILPLLKLADAAFVVVLSCDESALFAKAAFCFWKCDQPKM